MDAARIDEIVGEFVSLRRRGANLLGCCPFHNEKTPSFTVSPAKGIFKCFGCGEAGNAVHFLMKHEHYSYPEALKYIAKKYNIEVEEEQLSQEQLEKQTERDGLFHATEFAQHYFSDLLHNHELGKNIGLSYFYERGLSDEVINTFGLGYCLDEWDDFTKHALAGGYSENMLVKTGLTIKKDDGKTYDRFRGRVMFPVYSVSGRVLGFSGRVLSSEKQAAKYVNSPESEIYNKSQTLYGIYQARNAIAKQDLCYLVEGNIDVLSMYQSGIENTVASSGTSLTHEQIRLIKRYTKNITVLYDGDAAGIKAAFRAVNMLLEEGFHVRIVLFPDGEDPDSYAQKYGSSQIQTYVTSQATNFIIFKTKILLKEVQGDPIKRAELIKEIVQTIALVPEMIDRNVYIKECASILDISEQTLATELARCIYTHQKKQQDKDAKEASSYVQAQDKYGADADAQKLAEPKQPLVPETMFEEKTDERQEHKIISLLLNYGDRKIKHLEFDEEGTSVEQEYYVAAFIIADILSDDLGFDSAICQHIFDLYVEKLNQNEVLKHTSFIEHTDDTIRNLAISLLSQPYDISENWEKKFNIYVPHPDMCVDKDVRESLLNFKLKKLEKKIKENAQKLKSTTDSDEIMMLLSEQKKLKDIRILICKQLNRIVV